MDHTSVPDQVGGLWWAIFVMWLFIVVLALGLSLEIDKIKRKLGMK